MSLKIEGQQTEGSNEGKFKQILKSFGYLGLGTAASLFMALPAGRGLAQENLPNNVENPNLEQTTPAIEGVDQSWLQFPAEVQRELLRIKNLPNTDSVIPIEVGDFDIREAYTDEDDYRGNAMRFEMIQAGDYRLFIKVYCTVANMTPSSPEYGHCTLTVVVLNPSQSMRHDQLEELLDNTPENYTSDQVEDLYSELTGMLDPDVCDLTKTLDLESLFDELKAEYDRQMQQFQNEYPPLNDSEASN
ncbi:MAG: hypothetical protein OHK0017_05570 [Patescibacteria group bacterium]